MYFLTWGACTTCLLVVDVMDDISEEAEGIMLDGFIATAVVFF